ncbi:hypothetical protein NNO_1072 [Hydrogenimonas sp.]|nr:hypothetical protein NNO_1072 [Hydrogenimonas sp.]
MITPYHFNSAFPNRNCKAAMIMTSSSISIFVFGFWAIWLKFLLKFM